MKILIVDDHPINRKLLRVTLEAEGISTVEAADGAEGLATLEREPVDAILSDIFMPGMDGFRFCNAVRNNKRFGSLPFVIYTSTYTSPENEKLALEAGADRYLRKPCPTASLVGALQELIAVSQTRALERPQPIEQVEVSREYNEALVHKLEEKNADLERAMAQQRAVAELSQYALAMSSPIARAAAGAAANPGAQMPGAASGLEALFDRAVHVVASALGLSYAAIWEALPDGKVLRFWAGVGEQGPVAMRAEAGIDRLASLLTAQDGMPTAMSEETGTLAVALPGPTQPFGFLEASAGAPRSFKEEDVRFLEAVAGVLATALQRQLAEEEVLEQREWLRVTLTSIGDGVIASDASGKVTFVNPVAAALTGWTREEAVGQPMPRVFSIINAQTRQRADDLVSQVLRARTAINLSENIALLSRDGREVPIEDSAAPILDADGELAGVVLVFRDVTQSRQARMALRQSEERFRRLAEGLPELVWISDADGHAMYLNPPYCRYAGVELGTVEERLQLIHPEDLPRVAEAWDSAIRTASDFEAEYRLRRRDGQYRWFLTRCVYRRSPSGEIEGWLGTSTDIHDQKLAEVMLEKRVRERTADLQASEERFRQLAENIQEVFWMFEPGTGRLLYVSPTYDAVWGRSREEVYKRPGVFTDTVHPDDRQQVRQGLAANWRTYDQEFRILRPDGTLRWIRLRSFPVRDSKGEVYRLAGIATDRTEQKAAEDALVQAERLSVAGKLAATMVHEINNPLQSVIGCLGLANEVLENKADPSKYLQIAYEEVKRAAGIVEQLRSLARPTQQVRKEPTDLNKLLNDLLVLNGKHLENHNIDVIWEPDVELPLLAVMRDAIRQLFLNLMLNAGDAMPEGGTLRLSTAHLKSPPGVRIAVSDTGVGIPPDVLPRIFEAFYSTKSDGLGIGLYVCQNVVQQHGGRIEVESEPGVGTTFTVWLPEDGSYGSELPSNEDMPSSE